MKKLLIAALVVLIGCTKTEKGYVQPSETKWVDISDFSNNFTSGGESYKAQYSKDAITGFVSIKGIVNNSNGGWGAIATIPKDCAPVYIITIPCYSTNKKTLCNVRISPSGLISTLDSIYGNEIIDLGAIKYSTK